MKEENELEQTPKNIEVWEDVVRIRDLIISLTICSVTTMVGYLIAANDPARSLTFGLIGTAVGFIICSMIIKPKRKFTYVENEEE
ncbi:hypothetical protein ACFFIS_10965 [Virgibacillus soli]|uniref:Heme ABC transporter n=1 Tax=Paracerasibacillus soli TaxID=480284 RepID=A0ABU5CVC3_9BACI|nr:hypothetical protein [Virgibacillus soli]MDY0410331.1 hypothetical protein [Virgibacillus soli]